MDIFKAYLHILDQTQTFSENPMVMSEDIAFYLEKQLSIFFNQLDIAQITIDENSSIKGIISEAMATSDFKKLTIDVADLFFKQMTLSEDIKSSNLIGVYFSHEAKEYIGFLKLNFRTSYVHHVDSGEDGITNQIVKQMATLPHMSQKPDEGFIVELDTIKAYVKDKQVMIDGHKCFYITEKILIQPTVMNPKKAIDTAKKTADKIIEIYHDSDIIKASKVKEFISEQIEEKGYIDVETIAAQCFETKTEREAYAEKISESGLNTADLIFNEEQKKKIKRNHKIKTSSGVEILLPYNYASNGENLQVIHQPDGTISIKLDNLGDII